MKKPQPTDIKSVQGFKNGAGNGERPRKLQWSFFSKERAGAVAISIT